MIYKNELVGKFVKLRSVLERDSEFILSLRLNKNLNTYIHKLENNIEKQKQWIRKQQVRKGDYYFLISNLEDKPLGTISLYNIKNEQGEFGRWVSKGNSIENLESAILLHDFGFNILNLDRILSETVKDNLKVINFHRRFGANILNKYNKDPIDGFILQEAEIRKKDYTHIRQKNMELILKFL